ncbi:MAG: DUF6175 family protein [Muribaculaceae bacterium]|nr:DUF6175 family protein [Muribaculaceae bacterium]
MKKHILMLLLGLLVCGTAVAQNFSDNVSLSSQDGDIVAIMANASAQKKKDAEDLAIQSAFNALMHSGIEGLNSAQPMLTEKSRDYDYRFFHDKRYLHYLSGQPKTTKTEKVRGNTLAHVMVYINLKGLKAELERNKLPLSPAWSDAKAVKATASLNPTIVVVPATTAETGYSFEAMRNIIEKDPAQRYAIDRVAEEFQKNGYKTRDFVTQLQNGKTADFLRSGTQTDDATMLVQQLPGDIVVTVNCIVETLYGGTSVAEVEVKAVEKQTAGRLATKTFSSGQYHTRDHNRLADYAIKTISGDFFAQLQNSFDDMVRKGREVNIEFALAESVDWDFDSDAPASGNFFKDALEDWIRDNAFQGNYSMNSSTDKYIAVMVNVPLWDQEKNRSFTLSNFGGKLRKFLKSELGDEYKPKITSMGQKMLITIE